MFYVFYIQTPLHSLNIWDGLSLKTASLTVLSKKISFRLARSDRINISLFSVFKCLARQSQISKALSGCSGEGPI